MKILQKSFSGMLRCYRAILLAATFAGLVLQSQAQSYVLSSGNSSIQVDLNGGVYNWMVDGVNQLSQQWFYYRLGNSTGENPLQNISSPAINSSSATSVDATYTGSSYSVRTAYQLTGQANGSGRANLSETIVLRNTSTTDHFYFFQYSDFDLAGISTGQSVQFYPNNYGQYYQAVQTGANGAGVTETVNGLTSQLVAVQADSYGQILLSLTDGSPTTLNNTLSTGPAGNATFAYEWDIAPGQTVIISKLLAVVPEPSPMALMSSGILILSLLGRRRSARTSVA